VDPELMYSDSLLHDDEAIDREIDRISYGYKADPNRSTNLGEIFKKYNADNTFGAGM